LVEFGLFFFVDDYNYSMEWIFDRTKLSYSSTAAFRVIV